MPSNSFKQLLSSTKLAEMAKLRMVIHMFERIGEEELKGFIIIDRVVGKGMDEKGWSSCAKPLLTMKMADQHKGFEDAPGLAHADFANEKLGGGVLTSGCVQEEIRFA